MQPPISILLNVGLVALGGAAGAVTRYGLAGFANRAMNPIIERWLGSDLPVGTMVVNTLGCFAAGVLIYVFEVRGLLSDGHRMLLMTGFLGSLTTFSAFGIETFRLIEHQRWLSAISYVLLVVVVGIAAVALGWMLADTLSPGRA